MEALLQWLPELLPVTVAPPSAAPALALGVALGLGDNDAVPLPERVAAPVDDADPPAVTDPDTLALAQKVGETGGVAVGVSCVDMVAVARAVPQADDVAHSL